MIAHSLQYTGYSRENCVTHIYVFLQRIYLLNLIHKSSFWGRLLCTDIRYYATGEFKEDLLVLRNPLGDNRENFAIEVVTGQPVITT